MDGGTAVTGGVGGTTFGTLSSIGSDLSVSVSFNIANELLLAANDEQLSEDELIGLVLGFTVVFAAVQARLALMLAKRRERAEAGSKEELRELKDPHSMLDFAYLLVSIAQRIGVAISVQLLAQSVRTQQPSRLVRVVSLVGLATFFVFVESLTNRAIR